MAKKGTLTVRVIGDAAPMEKTLTSIGKKTAAFAAGVAAAGVAVGVGLFKVGQTLDGAFDTIRVGTGATGDALDGLKEDFRAVAASVPADMGDVGTAIADLNTRTGQTGESLQDLARRTLELSRLTKADLTATIAGTTRIFGDWGIATEDQAATLDKLFRASQATGIGVDALATTVVNFGAPLRQMGFSFEESIAMLGKFEKEGVNTEAILGGLKMALGRMAKAGEEPVETFQRLSEKIKQAGTDGEANGIAVEAFGTRAGPDLAAAIREGRFELSDYIDVVNKGTDTIMGAADETRSFSESFQEFKNRALLAIEPIATRVFELVGDFAETHGPAVSAFIETKLVPAFERFIARMAEIVDVWGPRVAAAIDFIRRNGETLIPIVGGIVAGFMAYKATIAVIQAVTAAQAALNVVMALNPIGLVIAAIAALAAGLVIAYKKSETFRNIVDGAFRAVGSAVEWLTDKFRAAMRVVSDFLGSIRNVANKVSGLGGGVVGRGIRALIPGFDHGGVVPGPTGSPRLIMAHGGETVVPTHRPGFRGGRGDTYITVNAPNYVGDKRDLERVLLDALQSLQRRGGPLPIAVRA